MAKPPPNLPAAGDNCRLRGKQSLGKVLVINPLNNWARVEWDPAETPFAPLMCHLYELEKQP
jgi:hypothetical protein